MLPLLAHAQAPADPSTVEVPPPPVEPPGESSPERAPPQDPPRALWVARVSSPIDEILIPVEGATVVLVGQERLWSVDRDTGEVKGEVPWSGGRALLVGGAVWTCGLSGVARYSLASGRLDEVESISDQVCAKLTELPSERPGACSDVVAFGPSGVMRLKACDSSEPEPSAATVPAPRARGRTDYAEELGLSERTLQRNLALRRCSLGVALHGAVSQTGRSWRALESDYSSTLSPGLGLACDFEVWGGLGWSVGLESAPWTSYSIDEIDMPHAIIATAAVGWAPEAGFVGAQVLGGITYLGVGAVARWQPFKTKTGLRHGPQIQANVALYEYFVGGASLGYTFSLGQGRSRP